MSEMLPVSASADSKRNAYYHRCIVVDEQRAYAACLARVSGELDNDARCAMAIRNNGCPVIEMRKNEHLQERAIYFVERSVVQTFVNKVREWVMPASKKEDESPKKSQSMMDQIAAGSQLDVKALVNKLAMKPPQRIDLLPGESPIDAIKRMRKRD